MTRTTMTNAEIARIIREIALFLDMEGVPFKPRAYEKAAHAIEAVDEPLADVYRHGGLKAIEAVPGVGRSIGEKIVALIETGRLPYHEELRRNTPVDVGALTAIEGLGPKMVKTLYDQLGVRTVDDLEAAAKAGKVRTLPHFGEKSEQKILKGIAFLKQSGGGGTATPRPPPPERVMDFLVAMPEVVHVHAKGSTKTSVKLATGMDVDVRVVLPEGFGAALMYFTGSKAHNIALRKLAQTKDLN